jgi:hypothetical protein
MRVLFFIKHPGALRLLEPPLRLLAEDGHEVHLAFDSVKTDASMRLAESLADEFPTITVGRSPKTRDAWSPLRDRLRHAIDYLRYVDPIYAGATKLRARAAAQAPRAAVRLGELPQPIPRVARRLLGVLERSIEPPRAVTAYLAEQRPDLVLVTPLIGLGSRQADFLRAARRAGIRTAFPVLSWDNLTNKGLLRDVPDRVLVWNDAQAQEATDLHGVPRERVAVTGAAAFDHWFDWQPTRTREELAAETGLRADRPILLYVCSSPFIAPDEVEFVEEWLGRLRAGGGPLEEAGVLIRPHPQNAEQWASYVVPGAQVAVWPREGEDPLDELARRKYFDSIFHSELVVGINTSALIESSIIGRPVHTVVVPRYRAVQEGTLHFGYLASSVLRTASTLDEHVAQLRAALDRGRMDDERIRSFVERFVRPNGLERRAAPCVVSELERLAAAPAPSPDQTRMVAPLVRRLARPLAEQARRSERQSRSKSGRKAGEPAAGTELDRVLHSDRPVLAGPWLSEVGFELLYWIPFLRHAAERDPTLPGRLAVVSRGGTASWYADVARRGYVEVFDYVAPEDLAVELDNRIAAGIPRKQLGVQPFDEQLIARVVADLGTERPLVLHPTAMYAWYWQLVKQGVLPARPTGFRFGRLHAPELPESLAGQLPDDYYAVRFYFNASFPATPQNRAVATELVEKLAARAAVVLLDPKTRFDDHGDLELDAIEGVQRIDDALSPAVNLAVQTSVIGGSRAFVGTYGGLSYLPPFLGVPALALYSDPARFRPQHLELAQRAFRGAEFASLIAVDVRDVDLLGAAVGAQLSTT